MKAHEAMCVELEKRVRELTRINRFYEVLFEKISPGLHITSPNGVSLDLKEWRSVVPDTQPMVELIDRLTVSIDGIDLKEILIRFPVAILLIDVARETDFTIEFINPRCEELLGVWSQQVERKPLDSLAESTGSDLVGYLRQVCSKAALSRELDVSEETFSLTNGRRILNIKINPLIDRNQNVYQLIGIFLDITTLKKTETELKIARDKAEESDRLKTAFLANMSHEIRTPLNGIMGFSQLLKEPDLSDDKKSQYIQVILDSGNRLQLVIEDILEIAAIESQQIEAVWGPVSLNMLIHELGSFYSQQVQPSHIEFTCETGLSDEESVVETDEKRLRQILANLLSNAFKFTHSGAIRLGYRLAGKEIEFYVSDTGIGIDPAFQPYVFDRFRQYESHYTRNYGGSGIGLTIAEAITRLLGGKIWLESQQGVGTTFYFSIPYRRIWDQIDKISLKAHETRNDTAPYRFDERKVLIAEDDAANYLYINELLQEWGWSSVWAQNGKEAMDICRANPYVELVLMDIKMPVMDGYEATQLIKTERPDLPIIALTAYAQPDDRKKVYQAGCDAYLAKPVEKMLLKATINNIVSQYSKLNAIRKL